MCGRFTCHVTAQMLAAQFGVSDPPELPARYNIAPSQPVPVVRVAGSGERRLAQLRWGLIPFWAKDAKIGNRLINARAESLAEKPSFKHAFKRRRCLVVASGFYEWQSAPGGKMPMYVSDPTGQPYGFAGLWERWRGPRGESIESCTIITVPANSALAGVHDRMPALLEPADQSLWLDHGASPARCQALLRPAPDRMTRHWPVSRQVNDPAHEGPGLMTPDAAR